MNINQVARLLNEASIKTICGINLLEGVHGQNENYFKLEKKKEEWIFSFVKCRKNSKGTEEIIKISDNEKEASKYYYLFELSNGYYNQYILPFEMKNKDICIGEPECTIFNLKEAFARLRIKENYYNFKKVKNEHSIFLEEIGGDKSRLGFIGMGGKIIFETPVMENWLTYYLIYKYVYYLFLLDNHCELLIKNKEIKIPFSDEEYTIFLK